jgi:hypothetical protein
LLLHEWQETSLLEPPRVAAQNLDFKVGSQPDPIANSDQSGLPVDVHVCRIDDRLTVPLVDEPALEPLGVFGRSATEEPLAGRERKGSMRALESKGPRSPSKSIPSTEKGGPLSIL